MSLRKSHSKVKPVLSIVMLCVAIGFIVSLFLLKGEMNEYASKAMKAQSSSSIDDEVAHYIDSAYNYVANGEKFKVTFLEIGSVGCTTCKRMESVLEEVRENYGSEVNVVFIHAGKPENRKFLKYYGIASIPTQVLLDKNGKEFFRHLGYITPEEIMKEVKRY